MPADENMEIRALRSGPASVLAPVRTVLPPPGRGEVQVAIDAAGVAYADIVMRRGLYAGVRPPVTPGYDFVGRVRALGPEVAGLVAGQRVAGITVSGSYALRRNVEARWLVPAPEGPDPASLVAAVLNGVTAWQLLHRIANPDPGEWVLVHGAAGGVGSLLLDLARVAGVRAIGAASKAKRDVVAQRGAEPIDYAGEDVAARARAISGGGGVGAFDHIGGRHLRRVSLAALRNGGTAVVYGGYAATRGGRFNPLAAADLVLNSRLSSFQLFSRSQGVVGYSVAAWRQHRTHAYRHDLSHVMKLVADGVISPLVGATMPLTEAARAHRALEERTVAGKIVLLPDIEATARD